MTSDEYLTGESFSIILTSVTCGKTGKDVDLNRTRGGMHLYGEAALTSISQYGLLETKLTLTGKKSLGCPLMLNSMAPVLLDSSMTGSDHCKTLLRLSKLYSPSHSVTVGEPTPALEEIKGRDLTG